MKAAKNKTSSRNSSKFVEVRQRPLGRWVAEIKDTIQKVRMWLGTFETAEEAARAYDEAACLLRGSNTRTNFVDSHRQLASESPLASRIRNLLSTKKPSSSSSKYQEPCRPLNTGSQDLNIINNTNSSRTTAATAIAAAAIDTKSTTSVPSTCDNVYKPDLSSIASRFDLHVEDYSGIAGWDFSFSHEEFMEEELTEDSLSEFGRMKFERQVSASLYAMNGLQEYMETHHLLNAVSGASDQALWCLPPLCPLLPVRSSMLNLYRIGLLSLL